MIIASLLLESIRYNFLKTSAHLRHQLQTKHAIKHASFLHPRQAAWGRDAVPSDTEGEGEEEQAHVSDQRGEKASALLQPHQLQYPPFRRQDGEWGWVSEGLFASI